MTNANNQRPIAIWLFICCAAIFAMVILGGVTRLTGSGLSIVQWEPVTGVLPPLNAAEWQEVFELYQQSPEYKLKNAHMGVDEFKSIFWFEYFHRLLGRLIGAIFLLPMLVFIALKRVDRALIPKLVTMFVLGGLQGLLGWFMVKSGLVNQPHVSQYRLTAHLGFAIVIYGYLFWVALGLFFPPPERASDPGIGPLSRFAVGLSILIYITVLSGGFVAGLKAGFAYSTFPLMNGKFIPDGLLMLEPVWRNFFENGTTVQFDHRVLATVLFLLIPAFWFLSRRLNLVPRLRLGVHLLLVALVAQVSLGISTLLLHVPVPLAAAHQGGALVLFTVSLFVTHQLRSSRIAEKSII